MGQKSLGTPHEHHATFQPHRGFFSRPTLRILDRCLYLLKRSQQLSADSHGTRVKYGQNLCCAAVASFHILSNVSPLWFYKGIKVPTNHPNFHIMVQGPAMLIQWSSWEQSGFRLKLAASHLFWTTWRGLGSAREAQAGSSTPSTISGQPVNSWAHKGSGLGSTVYHRSRLKSEKPFLFFPLVG